MAPPDNGALDIQKQLVKELWEPLVLLDKSESEQVRDRIIGLWSTISTTTISKSAMPRMKTGEEAMPESTLDTQSKKTKGYGKRSMP